MVKTNHSTPNNQPNVTPKTYARFKRFIIRAEHNNFDSIYIIPCTGIKGWQEIGDHSALFYYYGVLKNRTRKPKFQYDVFNGYYDHFELGRISVRNVDDVIHALRSGGYTFKLTKINAAGHPTTSQIHIVRIQLGITYSSAEVDQLIRQEESRRTACLKIPNIPKAMPDLYLDIISLTQTTHYLCNRNFNKTSRANLANDIVTECDNILRTYLECTTILSIISSNPKSPAYSHGIHKIIDKYHHIISRLNDLQISLRMAYIYQYINAKECCIAEAEIASIKQRLHRGIKSIQKEIGEQPNA